MSFFASARNLLRSLSLSIPLTIIFFDNVAYVAKVEGVSMQPTLNDDALLEDPESTFKRYFYRFNSSDLVLLSHWSTRNYNIHRGDIVSLVSPKNPSVIIIKRVIALEGDTVITRENLKFESIKIPRGHCWVEGDNHLKSMDSNVFGPVAVGLVTARAQCVLWPPRRWRALDAQLPPDRSASLVSVRPYNGSYNSGQQFIIELKNAPPCHFDLSSFEEHTRIE
ncbi:Mitochondrial inner membrane protease subunit 2 [Tyrophagus putrescentiae]|nr:Mitochondrial inner membrane protease subunit 2 [Tyrophagus putrescentiae]